MDQIVINEKQAPVLRFAVQRFGLACLLALLIFLPYTLLQLFGGGLVAIMGGGIGSPGGGRDAYYASAPWAALLVAACFTFLMAGKLLRDRHLVARWRAALLLLLIFLLLSACVLWQTPFVPIPSISEYYLSAGLLLLMSIYPCFFASLTSAFLGERQYQDGVPQKTGWLFIPLSIPAALAGSAFCWLAITSGLSTDASYWQGYSLPHYSPLIAALYMFPTLFGVSLVGGFLGLCLSRWFHRAFIRPAETVSLANMAERSTGSGEQAPSSAGTMRANWPVMIWEFTWRPGLTGLVSLIITGILLHMSIDINISNFNTAPFFERLLIGFEIYYNAGNWLIPPFLLSSLTVGTLFGAIYSFTFLPFLMPIPGVLVERSLWKKRAILPGLGIVLIFLGMTIGAMDLLLGLLHSLISFWPAGTGSALIYCATTIIATATLALLASLALSHSDHLSGKRGKRLLWLLIGVSSFAGSLLPLVYWLQQFIYYADDTTPFRLLSLDTAPMAAVLAASLLLSLPAALFGGWLRTRLTDALSDK